MHRNAMNPPNGRPSANRVLGDQRRETAGAAAAAARAARRRRLAGDDDADSLDENEAALFGADEYDEDDAEADEIYAAVDRRVEAGRSAQRDARVEAELKRYREENPTIGQQFAAPKRDLSAVSYDEWAAVPDIGDYSVKKQKRERYTPAPDSLLAQARAETAVSATAPAAGAATDLAAIGTGRSIVLGQNLDRAGSSTSAPATVDTNGYLTELAGAHISSAAEVSDIKRARLLLKSVTTTNPKHAPGWIAAARLEEAAGKLPAARALAAEGCARCPKAEDVWLEAARLYPPDRARRVLAQAVRHVPKAVKVWLQAAALETESKRKRRVLRKALEVVPRSARLWRAAVELEETAGARILLARAVECVPDNAGLWLALSKLQTYADARRTLSRARDALPAEAGVWTAAMQLEETALGGEHASVEALARKAVTSLSVGTDAVDRDRWLNEARAADAAGFPGTCGAIARTALSVGVDEADRRERWLSDAASAESAGAPSLARAIFSELVRVFPAREELWHAAVAFERRSDGGGERVQKLLAEAVEYCPTAPVLWLMLAKEEWRGAGGATAARQRLDRALQANPDSEAVWLAAAKVETEGGEFVRARLVLQRARESLPSARVIMKSALLERQLGDAEAELAFLQGGVDEFPDAEKLWLMLAQWYERRRDTLPPAGGKPVEGNTDRSPRFAGARAVYEQGVLKCPRSAALWTGLARLAEKSGGPAAGRAVLERGRQSKRSDDDADLLWREGVYLEVRAGGAGADAVLARALRECPASGAVWALAMALASKSDRRARTGDALRACGTDSRVVAEAGKVLWRDHKIAKARAWLLRACGLDGGNGDAWAALLAFEKTHGGEEKVKEVERKVGGREDCRGDVWTAVRKAIGNETLSTVEVLREAAGVSSHTTCTTGLFYSRETKAGGM